MLTQIQAAAAAPRASLAEALQAGDSRDAVDLLLSCHQRIRHFSELAVKLASPEAPSDQIPAVAGSVHRYFNQALPLHEADENESVHPRLQAVLNAAGSLHSPIAAADLAMIEQHQTINAQLAVLLPHWRALAEGQPSASPHAHAADAQHLRQAWRAHLDMEEQLIFPALRSLLSEDDRLAIRREMTARRQLP